LAVILGGQIGKGSIVKGIEVLGYYVVVNPSNLIMQLNLYSFTICLEFVVGGIHDSMHISCSDRFTFYPFLSYLFLLTGYLA
jgi:hypothetical protein